MNISVGSPVPLILISAMRFHENNAFLHSKNRFLGRPCFVFSKMAPMKIVMGCTVTLIRPKLCRLYFPNILYTKIVVPSYPTHVLLLYQEKKVLFIQHRPFTLSCISKSFENCMLH